MSAMIRFFQYLILITMFLILNFVTFGYQELMMDKVSGFVDLLESLGLYIILYLLILVLSFAFKGSSSISKKFIKYNLLFPLSMIAIGVIFKIFRLDYYAGASDSLKVADFLAIIGFITFVVCRIEPNNNQGEEKTIDEEDKVEFEEDHE